MEERLEALERRVRALEDTEALRRLKAEYGELVDARFDEAGFLPRDRIEPLADRIADLFTEEAVWDGAAPGVSRGRSAIRDRFLSSTLVFSWHFFVKPQIEVHGDRATGRWDIFSPCTMPDGRAFWMTGVEDDEYVREEGIWRHSSMKLRVVFMAPYETGWAARAPRNRETTP